jgi:regulator of protease activity HflC (stomatin/prohibitin superfamily)
MRSIQFTAAILVLTFFTSCAVIRPGEVGVKQKIGKLSENILEEGPHLYNPFVTKIIKAPIRTENLEIKLNLPSKEGLNIDSQISVLYRIEKTKVPELIETVGLNYENIIRNIFRSASADVCSQFLAKDMHSGKRAEIEKQIQEIMDVNLKERGIIVEAVLMKSIKLPPGLYASIEDRLEAEQDALRMQFILDQERLEAERKIIQAEGERDAQLILAEGLSEEILKLRSIEAFLKLAESDGAKLIITDGSEIPFITSPE